MEELGRVLAETIARTDKMAAEMEQARNVGRETIFRVALLSATIVGFSATLLSIRSVSTRVDLSLLTVSWSLFAAVVALGPFLIYVEARAQYAITWRAEQQSNFDPRTLSAWDNVKFWGVLAYTVIVRPRRSRSCAWHRAGSFEGSERTGSSYPQPTARAPVTTRLALSASRTYPEEVVSAQPLSRGWIVSPIRSNTSRIVYPIGYG